MSAGSDSRLGWKIILKLVFNMAPKFLSALLVIYALGGGTRAVVSVMVDFIGYQNFTTFPSTEAVALKIQISRET